MVPMRTPDNPLTPEEFDQLRATPCERLIVMVRTMREVPVEELHFRDWLEMCRMLQDMLFWLEDVTTNGFHVRPRPRAFAEQLLQRAMKSQLPVGPPVRQPGEPRPTRKRPDQNQGQDRT